MHNVYVKDLINYCGGALIKGDKNTALKSFSKDTRTLQKGDVYIGIKGESFDGCNLYQEAIKKGAIGCILNDNTEIDEAFLNDYANVFIVTCNDTIKCLGKLAAYKRSLYSIPVVGITGSVGKTSVKDIVSSVLSQKYKVLKTEGNYNNEIGLPLTILNLDDHEIAVIEMGMNNQGEISYLSKIARPSVSIITNVGTAHIGNLGSRENILKAKLEILDGMDESGKLIINNDNDLLHDYYSKHQNDKIITYGIKNTSDYMASNITSLPLSSSYDIEIKKQRESIEVNVPGNHFVLNSLGAIAIGRLFGLSINQIKKGIETFKLTKKRMEIEKISDYTIINDSYNANLDSMTSAINYLGTIKKRKIAVLGDMLELGDYSEKLHRMLGKVIIDNQIDYVITVGNESKYIYEELINNGYHNVSSFDNNIDAFEKLKSIIKKDDYILLKASNGMHFSEIYDLIKHM